MAIAVYIKEDTEKKRLTKKRRDKTFFAAMALFGAFAIVFSAWPFVTWQLKTLPKLTTKVDAAPIPQGKVLSASMILNNSVEVIQNPDGFSYFATNYKPNEKRPKEFYISIPKLKIKEALTKVDSLNFYENLSHFPGSALPGEVGNVFVTGHSTLPQFTNPKNYKTIFSKLSDLEVGDDVFVKIEGQTLHYTVLYSKIVDPHDVSVLASISANGRNLTLMTCVPPGTSTKRLVVITSLI